MAYRFRGRGQFTAPTSRSGRGYVYAGRSVKLQSENFQLSWNGPQVVNALYDALVDAFSKVTDDALDYMQTIVPVDTGKLRDSCYVSITENYGRLRIQIGATAYYAVYVELGTSSRSAQPFIRPTYDYVLRILPGIVRNEVRSRAR